MSSIKTTIESFLYPFIDRYTETVYNGGEDTVIEGIAVLQESSAFTHGALIHATAILYIQYKNCADERADEILKRLNSFIDITLKLESVKTWGKLGILRGLHKLARAGLINDIPSDKIRELAQKTDYSDFLDKESLSLIDYPTNYYQVALGCALYREYLGFEDEGMSAKLEKKLIEVSFPDNDSFMDDEPGYGRYDRYSFILSSEISDRYMEIGKPLPEIISRNLTICAKHSLFMANACGDGFNYGRSLSMHGDLTPAEILASALSRGLIKDDDKDTTLAYIFAILQKTLYFWYNPRKQSFDIWWDGRTTNNYRGIHRLLEVNMDMVSHLYTLYENIAAAGLELTAIPAKFAYPKKWEYEKLEFAPSYIAYILRYKDMLAMIPFIGTKQWGLCSAYNPHPAINGFVEGSPTSTLPFLIPEYLDNRGTKYRPLHYVGSTEEKEVDGGLLITAFGKLMIADDTKSKTDIDYRQDVFLRGNEIIVEFEVEEDLVSAEMITATQNESTKILVGGFDESEILEITDTNDFKTPHGSYSLAFLHHSSKPKRLGYKITLDI